MAHYSRTSLTPYVAVTTSRFLAAEIIRAVLARLAIRRPDFFEMGYTSTWFDCPISSNPRAYPGHRPEPCWFRAVTRAHAHLPPVFSRPSSPAAIEHGGIAVQRSTLLEMFTSPTPIMSIPLILLR